MKTFFKWLMRSMSVVALLLSITTATYASETLQGQLFASVEDDFANKTSKTRYYIRTESPTKTSNSQFEYKEIPANNQLRQVTPGSHIKIEYSTQMTRSSQDYTVEVLDTAESRDISTKSSVGTKSIAVIRIKYTGQPEYNYSVSDIDRLYNTAAQNYFKESSFGKLQIQANVYGTYQIPYSVGCGLFDVLMSAVNAADSDIDFSKYDQIGIFLDRKDCSLGVGSVGDWVIETNEGQKILPVHYTNYIIGAEILRTVVVHEMGHNFGLEHANSLECGSEITSIDLTKCESYEYNDPFDAMGFGKEDTFHFSAYHKDVLGWMDDTVLTISDWRTRKQYVITPLEKNHPGIRALKIPVRGSTNDGAYYIENREPIGFDKNISSSYASGVVIKRKFRSLMGNSFIAALDMTPQTSNDVYEDTKDGGLSVGQYFSDPSINLLIKTVKNENGNVVVEVGKHVKPKPISPKNDITVPTLKPTLTWKEGSLAGAYSIQIAKDAEFTKIVYQVDTNNPSTSHVVTTDLPSGTVLYWRVRSIKTGFSKWGKSASFRTPKAPKGITLLSPVNVSIVNKSKPITFSWNPAKFNPSAYRIQVSQDINFTKLVHNQVYGTSATTQTVFIKLNPGEKYYWRVAGINQVGQGKWSNVGTFATKFDAPIGLSPWNGLIASSKHPTFGWEPVAGPVTNYRVQVSYQKDFSSLISSVKTNTSWPAQASVVDYKPGKPIYWRVRALNGYTKGPWSDPIMFYVLRDY